MAVMMWAIPTLMPIIIDINPCLPACLPDVPLASGCCVTRLPWQPVSLTDCCCFHRCCYCHQSRLAVLEVDVVAKSEHLLQLDQDCEKMSVQLSLAKNMQQVGLGGGGRGSGESGEGRVR